MLTNRREFLKQTTAVAAGTLLLPSFLKGNGVPNYQGNQLVVIQLSGGNDGLNTIIPYRNDLLYKLRPSLMSPQTEILKLDDETGLNKVMGGLRNLYNEGDISLINNVGYPNPNRSHFRSMDIWHSASESNEYLSTGWLGRYLDQECSGNEKVTAIEIGQILDMALKGEHYKGIALKSTEALYRSTRQLNLSEQASEYELANYLYKTAVSTSSTANYLYETKKVYRTKREYPQSDFAQQLKEIAELICSGVESPIYYVSLSGFDTHNKQEARQGRLLKIYSDAMEAFVADLKAHDQWKNTLMMTFSEFGRRVKQNASGGTDHGQANNMIMAGGNLKKQGLYNSLPDLSNLSRGDIKHQIDFRQVYTTILDKWLAADSQTIMRRYFEKLSFI